MDDPVREAVLAIVGREGRDVVTDARRFQSLLLDYCPNNRREINLLLTAIAADVPTAIKSSETPSALLLPRLAQRLRADYGLDEAAAMWAVETLAQVYGRSSRPTGTDTVPLPAPKPHIEPLPAPNPFPLPSPAPIPAVHATRRPGSGIVIGGGVLALLILITVIGIVIGRSRGDSGDALSTQRASDLSISATANANATRAAVSQPTSATQRAAITTTTPTQATISRTPTASAARTPSAGVTPTAVPASTTAGAAKAGQSALTVTMLDLSCKWLSNDVFTPLGAVFAPLQAGPVAITIENAVTSSGAYTVEFHGNGVDYVSPSLVPGKSVQVSLTFSPGKYTSICNISKPQTISFDVR